MAPKGAGELTARRPKLVAQVVPGVVSAATCAPELSPEITARLASALWSEQQRDSGTGQEPEGEPGDERADRT